MSNAGASRARAARIISEWRDTGAFPDRLLDSVQEDRPFTGSLVQGVVAHARVLDHLVDGYCKRTPDPMARALLMIGLYQLLYMDKVESYAAVNETVAACPLLHIDHARGFVNAVLRRADREREKVLERLAKKPPALRTSHPDELYERWVTAFGEEDALQLAEWNNLPPELSIRLDLRRVDMDRFVKAAGGNVTPLDADPTRFARVTPGTQLKDLPGFGEGWFVVQDPATYKAVELLNVEPGMSVLDACAAPGGKAMAIGELLKGKGTLVLVEKHADRVPRLEENVKRMRVKAKVVTADARDATNILQRTDGQKYDRILLDVPCSNTGVIRRRKDARWRFNRLRLEKLNAQQHSLLDSAAQLLADGGGIVYSTCSLESDENEDLVRSWLTENPSFQLAGEHISRPWQDGTDGAYAARIERIV